MCERATSDLNAVNEQTAVGEWWRCCVEKIINSCLGGEQLHSLWGDAKFSRLQRITHVT